ncbi:Deoxyribodipyrimidine photo-lyase [Venturia nashicola]|uniref:Deoxyribodipyrimidine photo-lyase n=1 Tax=Venturia nashicola TaxID=86259 RepID=A0A4Z1PCN7_9PEZI|nr:Deoxyribodipyrimidine photo-lyase [Venturia nashicola]TLD38255.1 Deoxyribodipyrimidine photo-lyase [Venturia nashicola]
MSKHELSAEQIHPSTKRAKQIDANPPFEELKSLIDNESKKQPGTGGKSVIHWFRNQDLRMHDNKALYAASQSAKEHGKNLICIYIYCLEEIEWHGVGSARLDFLLMNFECLKQELEKLDIPFAMLNVDKRSDIVPKLAGFVKKYDAQRVFANFEYEIDEVRRDTKVVETAGEGNWSFELHHDQTIMEPGTLTTSAGKPMKVFTPYHNAWLQEIKAEPYLLDTVQAPEKNNKSARKELRDLFDIKIPEAPKEKTMAKEERSRIRKFWPAGHDEAAKRMQDFVSKNLDNYAATRSNPAEDSTSRMSAYFNAGVYSMREALQEIKKYNKGSTDFTSSGAKNGVYAWVREIVFRELYRQTMAYTPHTAMNLPQNLKFDFVEWEDDEEGYKRWEEGTLGVPFVDAGMRQIKHEAWMHNRLRMNVSSYLYCNLLIDYRRGERYFATTLVDWDLSNNTQGWEPSYTVFNPVSQAEKNDPNGEYIRRWIPELKDVKGKAVFDPYHRLSKEEFGKLGYPEPYVDWNETKARCLDRYKRDMKEAEP